MAPAPADRERDADDEMDFLGEHELLQAVMKNLGEAATEADADAMFPLAGALGLGLLGCDDDELRRAAAEEANALRERADELQARLERRCDFLARRLRLRQARAHARHASEEAFEAFSRAHGGPRGRRMSRVEARAFVQRLGAAVALPPQPTTTPLAPPGETSVALPASVATAARRLATQLRLLRRQIDEDATESSSGAESDDEAVPYSPAATRQIPLVKRALWKWSQERASIASQWTWLQAQIQELEYKIRQVTELERRVRTSKGVVELESTPKDNEEDLDSCARLKCLNRTAFRKRKLLQMHNLHTAANKAARPSTIRCICQWPLGGCAVCTGRVLPMHPLPVISTLTKQERLALVDPGFHPVLSTSKEISTSVQYAAKIRNPQWQQKCIRNTMKLMKGNIPNTNKFPPSNVPKNLIISTKSHSKKKKHSKSKRGRPAVVEIAKSIQTKRRTSTLDSSKEVSGDGVSFHGDPLTYPSGGSSPVPSPSEQRNRIRERTERSRLNSSYDIDNIVIPHSIAATTKPEILQYKEILTPKWRIIENENFQVPNNGIIRKQPSLSTEEKNCDVEDILDATIMARHERCEQLEKGKYLQKRKSSRRQQSRSGASSSHPLTPSETPPHTPATMQVDETSSHSESVVLNSTTAPLPNSTTSTSESLVTITTHSANISNKRRLTLQMDDIEIISPYSPRTFPLSDDTYNKMLLMMPDNHPLSSADGNRRHQSGVSVGSDSESNSIHTYCITEHIEGTDAVMEQQSDSENDSGSVPPEEDPNDPEWNMSAHAD